MFMAVPVVAALGRPVVVIHGSGVNTAMILAIATLAARATTAAMVGRTTSAPPPVSPSATGGVSRSCIHKFSLVAVPNSKDERLSLSYALFARGIAPHSHARLFDARKPRCDWKNNTE